MASHADSAAQSGEILPKEHPDTGLMGLALLAQFHGVFVDIPQLLHQYGDGKGHFNETTLLLCAKSLGVKAKIAKQPLQRIAMANLPALVLSDTGTHFILAKVEGERVLIHDLVTQKPKTLTMDEFAARYDGRLLVMTSRASIAQSLSKFDFTWFIPAIVKYRKLLMEVLAVSLVLQIFALITPLFFQVVMDKVLVHRSFTTLDVIAAGLLIVTLFDVGLSALRNYVFSHTTSRIDVELGAKLFKHMLNLPIAYFETRRVGETVARVRELENIRNFLTGQALTTILDLFFSVIFIIVMLFYSGWLTLIVIVSLPCYAIWSASITPVLRHRLNEKFIRSADNQSFLVESVSGMNTIKAMAVEPHMARKWDNQLSAYVNASFRVTRLANIGQHGVQLIQKLVVVATLWGGRNW